eukprot:Rhum_TRINITY_DN14540_c1_g1::Rhum_TRINITY_DN14540_c1_g1_i1::g.96323::m.96323
MEKEVSPLGTGLGRTASGRPMKVWVRISGKTDDEAIGIRVPNREGYSVGELKELMLPLVSFQDFPVTVDTVEPRHLDLLFDDAVLGNSDSALQYVDKTLVVMPTAEACLVRDDDDAQLRPALRAAAPAAAGSLFFSDEELAIPPRPSAAAAARDAHNRGAPASLAAGAGDGGGGGGGGSGGVGGGGAAIAATVSDPLTALWEDLPSLATPLTASPATVNGGGLPSGLSLGGSGGKAGGADTFAGRVDGGGGDDDVARRIDVEEEGVPYSPRTPETEAEDERQPDAVAAAAAASAVVSMDPAASKTRNSPPTPGGGRSTPPSPPAPPQSKPDAAAATATTVRDRSRGKGTVRSRLGASRSPVRSRSGSGRLSPAPSFSTTYETSDELQPIPGVSQSVYLRALADTKQSDWQVQCKGLTALRQFAIHHTHFLISNLQTILLAVTECLKCLRSAVMRHALLAFADIVRSECRDQKAMDAQLETLTTEILRLATGDNQFIREAAEECFDETVRHITDKHRFRLISKMLASAASSKDGAVRAECISVIRKALKHLDNHSIRSYTKMSLLLKATHNFLGDASASCRQNARVLADELAGLLGGIPEYVALMRQYMPGRQVDEVCRALGGAWCQHDATAPPPSPPASARSASSRLASRSPSRPSRLASTSPSRHRASSTHRAPTSPALSATAGAAGAAGSGGDVPPETTHAATPSLADLVHAQVEKKACTQFRPRWGNPSMCDSCKLKKEAHVGGPTGASGLRRPQTSGTHARPAAATGTAGGVPQHKRLNLNGTLTSASASSASGMSARSSKRSGTTLGHGKPSSPVGMRRSTSSSSKPGGAATARERAAADRSHAWETASQNSRTSAASRASKASTAARRRNTSQPHKPPPTPPLASPTSASAASGSGRLRTSSTAAAAAKAAQRSAARSASPAQAAAAAAAPTSPTLAKPARKKPSGGADLVGKLDQAIIEEMRSFLVTKKAQQQQQQNSPRECDSERSTSGGGASVAASVIEAEAAHKAELGRLKEAHQKEMEEKDKMIFSLLKENMQLKLDLEKAKEDDRVTILTTPQFSDAVHGGGDSSTVGSPAVNHASVVNAAGALPAGGGGTSTASLPCTSPTQGLPPPAVTFDAAASYDETY